MTALAEAMINYRARERITQTELAKKVGVSLQTICSIETGSQTPSKMTVAKIMLVLNERKKEN